MSLMIFFWSGLLAVHFSFATSSVLSGADVSQPFAQPVAILLIAEIVLATLFQVTRRLTELSPALDLLVLKGKGSSGSVLSGSRSRGSICDVHEKLYLVSCTTTHWLTSLRLGSLGSVNVDLLRLESRLVGEPLPGRLEEHPAQQDHEDPDQEGGARATTRGSRPTQAAW